MQIPLETRDMGSPGAVVKMVMNYLILFLGIKLWSSEGITSAPNC